MKFILSLLIAFSLLFSAAGQVQAITACTTQDNCKVGNVQYTCKGVIGAPGNTDRDDPTTPTVIDHGGLCGGPCTEDAECNSFKSAPFSWNAVKCTGTPVVGAVPAYPGVCAELPPGAKQLSAGPQSGILLLGIIDVTTNWVFAIFVVLSIIFILLAAFQFVTAGGQAEKVGEARQKLIWAAVGIMVALISKGLVPVIKAIVGG